MAPVRKTGESHLASISPESLDRDIHPDRPLGYTLSSE